MFRKIAVVSSFAALVFVSLLHGSDALAESSVLRSTGVEPGAEGRAKFVRKASHGGARLVVRARGLRGGAAYEVVCAGIHLADVTAGSTGAAKARFRANDKRKAGTRELVCDPTAGSLVVARDDTAVLEGEVEDGGVEEEPSPSISPSVSEFDGDPAEVSEPSPSASASVSPVDGGDGDGTADDEPSASVSPSASADDGTEDQADEQGNEPSPTASPSVSEDDVSVDVSADDEPSPSDADDAEPSPSDDGGEDDGSGSSDGGDSSNSGPGAAD